MAKKSFGLPYKGSKNIIAKSIVDALPRGERLVELFAGGCAVTDYALKNTDKFNEYFVNDLNGWSPQAYEKALNGGFNDEERWISREDFFRLKDTDPYVYMCFSFGNKGNSYMYSKELEPYKRALHYIIFWEDYKPMEDICPQVVDIIKEYCKGKDRKGRRLASGHAVADHIKQKGSVEYWQSNPMFRAAKIKWSKDRRGKSGSDLLEELRDANIYGPKSSLESLECLERLERLKIPNNLQSLESLERLQSMHSLDSLQKLESLISLERLQSIDSMKKLESLVRLERLESLQSMESLERLQRLETSSMSYVDYAYRDGDVVYCDPPYNETDGYEIEFDSAAFWEWARTRNYPVYVSEYQAPDDFVSIWSREKRSLLSSTGLTAPRIEHLFLHKKWI